MTVGVLGGTTAGVVTPATPMAALAGDGIHDGSDGLGSCVLGGDPGDAEGAGVSGRPPQATIDTRRHNRSAVTQAGAVARAKPTLLDLRSTRRAPRNGPTWALGTTRIPAEAQCDPIPQLGHSADADLNVLLGSQQIDEPLRIGAAVVVGIEHPRAERPRSVGDHLRCHRVGQVHWQKGDVDVT